MAVARKEESCLVIKLHLESAREKILAMKQIWDVQKTHLLRELQASAGKFAAMNDTLAELKRSVARKDEEMAALRELLSGENERLARGNEQLRGQLEAARGELRAAESLRAQEAERLAAKEALRAEEVEGLAKRGAQLRDQLDLRELRGRAALRLEQRRWSRERQELTARVGALAAANGRLRGRLRELREGLRDERSLMMRVGGAEEDEEGEGETATRRGEEEGGGWAAERRELEGEMELFMAVRGRARGEKVRRERNRPEIKEAIDSDGQEEEGADVEEEGWAAETRELDAEMELLAMRGLARSDKLRQNQPELREAKSSGCSDSEEEEEEEEEEVEGSAAEEGWVAEERVLVAEAELPAAMTGGLAQNEKQEQENQPEIKEESSDSERDEDEEEDEEDEEDEDHEEEEEEEEEEDDGDDGAEPAGGGEGDDVEASSAKKSGQLQYQLLDGSPDEPRG